MYYGLHTTTGEQRQKLLASENFEIIDIKPIDMHGKKPHKPIVWEEGSERFYEHDISGFLKTLEMLDNGTFPENDVKLTPYYEQWSYKGEEIITRLRNLPGLYESIKRDGIQLPVDVMMSGERIDGSFRSKIALHLGIPTIKARLRRFNWEEVDEAFLERKLKARWLSSGKDYYEFSFGYKDWKNVPEAGPVYRENATDRWEILRPLIKGKVLDLGCNEGFMSLMAALDGHEVVGYDHDWIHVANLNRLVFEWVNKTHLPATFAEQDIRKVNCAGFDTILALNVIYHISRDDAVKLLRKCKGTTTIFQCNLRKSEVREEYFGAHPDDLKHLLKLAGMKVVAEIAWRDKPIIIAK